jgi:amino acid adenylation domain-containing protein
MASVETLGSYVTRAAERRPEATAVVMGDERQTYGALDEAANRLARLLKDARCIKGDRICLFVPKSPAAIVATQAVLKADCAYVPIDIDSPAPRVHRILQAAEPRLVLTTSAAAGLIDELFAIDPPESTPMIGSLEDKPVTGENFGSTFTRADCTAFSGEPLESTSGRTDPAHILFTSGSTGAPKGVVIEHRNVIEFVEWAARYFGIRPEDRISGHPPLHFDLSTFDIYGTFLAGAALHLVPPEASLLPHKVAELIRSAELTQWFAVPSIFTYMAKFDVVRHGDFPSLERVLWCGEVLPTPILRYWMERVSDASFTNLYGPTEATIASSYYTVPAIPANETEPIPIGTPCAGEELIVLDERLEAVPSGEIGDLYIAGVGLSPGYWRDEEKTRVAFMPDPRAVDSGRRIYKTGDLARWGEDGLVYFLGRADSQIKHRGYRIELGEIETALDALAEIRECAVMGVDTGGFEGTAICCAYAPAAGAAADPPLIRRQLAERLPKYMLPARWLELDQLPKNVNGKIDRRRLRERFEEEIAARAPTPAATAAKAG